MNAFACQILLLDPDPQIAAAIGNCPDSLTPLKVTRCASCRSAREQLASTRFDLVVTRLNLGDCPATCIVQSLQQEMAASGCGAPVVVLASEAESSLEESCLAADATEFLVMEEQSTAGLVRSIRRSLQRAHQQRDMRRMLRDMQGSQQALQSETNRVKEMYRAAHEFVDTVSHDFRTPLTVIKEFTSLVQEGFAGQINAKQREMLEVVEDRVNALNVLVDDMLDTSKLEAGSLAVERGRLQPQDILESAFPLLERTAALKKVQLKLVAPANLPAVYCDREKAARTLTNLVVNAIKYAGRPGQTGQVWIQLSASDEDLTIAVQDNGPGIPLEQQQLIFERFRQLAPSVSREKGFGLGLHIAQQLVYLNYGTLKLVSSADKGTCFSFTLPVDDTAQLAQRFLARQQPGTNIVHAARIAICGDDGAATPLDEFVEEMPEAADWQEDVIEVAAMLNYFAGPNDMLLPTDDSWMLLTSSDPEQTRDLQEEIHELWQSTNRNRPSGPLPELDIRTFGPWQGSSRNLQGWVADSCGGHAGQTAGSSVASVPMGNPQGTHSYE